METLLKISIILGAGILGGKIAKLFKLPSVTGYLVAGLLIGPSALSVVAVEDGIRFGVISELALAIIAFSIGSEFVVKELRKTGKAVTIITIAEVIGAVGVVFVVMHYIFKQPFAFSIVIAAMSAATAPAATLLVIKQFRAKGPLTKTIIPVVALDDIAGIIVFGLAMSLARLSLGGVEGSLAIMLMAPLLEIIGSLVLGFITSLVFIVAANRLKNDEEDILLLVLGAIGLTAGLANYLALSPLLSCIMLGTMVANLLPNANRAFAAANKFSPPVYLMFFTLAGATLDLQILRQVGLIGIGYIFARASGKMFAAWSGAKIAKCPDTVCKYLGLGLMAQGGVSIGLSVLVRQQLPEYATAITTIIMFSVLIYEISGPILAKIAIQKAGEIGISTDKELKHAHPKHSEEVELAV